MLLCVAVLLLVAQHAAEAAPGEGMAFTAARSVGEVQFSHN
jgi:hypothetical protein